MGDMRAGFAQDFKLAFVEPNAMRQDDVRRGKADIVQVFDVTAARFALNHLDLIFVFRSVRVNHDAMLARKMRDLDIGPPLLPRVTFSASCSPHVSTMGCCHHGARAGGDAGAEPAATSASW